MRHSVDAVNDALIATVVASIAVLFTSGLRCCCCHELVY
ncbi:hypothetical protein DM2_2320 [Halorubrum sp. DM2]|nr:hypothetical protein DM2_2320 [Halorubrum sp. DM2]